MEVFCYTLCNSWDEQLLIWIWRSNLSEQHAFICTKSGDAALRWWSLCRAMLHQTFNMMAKHTLKIEATSPSEHILLLQGQWAWCPWSCEMQTWFQNSVLSCWDGDMLGTGTLRPRRSLALSAQQLVSVLQAPVGQSVIPDPMYCFSAWIVSSWSDLKRNHAKQLWSRGSPPSHPKPPLTWSPCGIHAYICWQLEPHTLQYFDLSDLKSIVIFPL